MTRCKAEDAGGLTPAKDDNAAPYHFDRRTLPIFKCVDYKRSQKVKKALRPQDCRKTAIVPAILDPQCLFLSLIFYSLFGHSPKWQNFKADTRFHLQPQRHDSKPASESETQPLVH